MKKKQAIEEVNKWKENRKNIRFNKLCLVVEAFGFRYKGGRGDHVVYSRNDVVEILNFQNVNGKAKPYQVKQFIDVVEKYGLLNGDDNV